MNFKIVLFILLLGNLITTDAQVVSVGVDPDLPVAGQDFNLLVESWICLMSVADSVVEIDGNNIRVFVLLNDVCGTITPIPPVTFTDVFVAAEISGLDEGVYDLAYYQVQVADQFPPMAVDYPLYFIDEIQFEVRGPLEPAAVNATSTFGLLLFVLFMILLSMKKIRRRLF